MRRRPPWWARRWRSTPLTRPHDTFDVRVRCQAAAQLPCAHRRGRAAHAAHAAPGAPGAPGAPPRWKRGVKEWRRAARMRRSRAQVQRRRVIVALPQHHAGDAGTRTMRRWPACKPSRIERWRQRSKAGWPRAHACFTFVARALGCVRASARCCRRAPQSANDRRLRARGIFLHPAGGSPHVVAHGAARARVALLAARPAAAAAAA
jgi:hypothetical protein